MIAGMLNYSYIINISAYVSNKHKMMPISAIQEHVDISSAPIVEKHVEVVQKSKPQTTYVQRTVIPNYVEKTIHVPSYVEKTVRVPTLVEKRIKVPAPPTVIEKTVAAPPSNVNFEKRYVTFALFDFYKPDVISLI